MLSRVSRLLTRPVQPPQRAHGPDHLPVRRQGLIGRCHVEMVRRGVVEPGSGLCSGRGGVGGAGDLLPDGEADGHLGSVVVCGQPVASGPEVG